MIVIVNVDNLIRPRLVGQETGMHDLMVFFSTLGGIAMFGPMGFIIGPMVAALFLSLLDIYSAEFRVYAGSALAGSGCGAPAGVVSVAAGAVAARGIETRFTAIAATRVSRSRASTFIALVSVEDESA